MVTNQTINNGSVAGAFNESTKLQYINLSNKPPRYKIYPGLRSIPLPDVAGTSGPEMSTLQAIRGTGQGTDRGGPLTLQTLAELLYHAAAVIRRRTLRDGEVHYRAAASAGALYPTEVYVVCGDLDGLRAGVYHFNPLDFSLERLRNGDLRRWIAAASQDDAAYPATLVFTTVFWRSAWKYRERGYRYCYWDLGTIAANLTAAGTATATAVGLAFGFVDRSVAGFLGIDGLDEAPSLLATIGNPDGTLDPGFWRRSGNVAPRKQRSRGRCLGISLVARNSSGFRAADQRRRGRLERTRWKERQQRQRRARRHWRAFPPVALGVRRNL